MAHKTSFIRIPVDVPEAWVEETVTSDALTKLQEIVGGYVEMLPTVLRWRQGEIKLAVNEEGLMRNLPVNNVASNLARRPVVGNAVLVYEKDTDWRKMPAELASSIIEWLAGIS